MIRIERACSLLLRARMLVMRLPVTYPSRIIVTVDSMLRTIFCAVPAFMRLEPASTSGPTTGTIATSTARVISDPGAQVTATVNAPSARARSTAPIVYGVRPDAAMPTTASSAPTPRRSRSRPPASRSSSEASTAWWHAS